MIDKLKKFLLSNWLLLFICLILSIIPFFWFKPGYLDIGGDSSRLYFYDPFNYLKHFVLNPFLTDSLGIKSGQTYQLPFVFFLTILHFIFRSPWVVNNLFNSINLIAPFLIVYAITKDFMETFWEKSKIKDFYKSGAIIAGLFYIFIPISSAGGWDTALIIQTERFVYPLIFLLILKFVKSSKVIYLILILLTSFTFAQNFAWVALPNMLSFFLLSFLYFFIYIFFIKKTKVSFKKILIGLIAFPLLQAFQYLPLLANIFVKNSDVSNQLLQGNNLSDVFHYVDVVASYTQRGYQLIGVTPFSPLTLANALLIVFPALIVLMLIKNQNKKILIPVFFILLLYWLVTARITKFGLTVFKEMFYIPGFVMFRDFYGRFLEVFLLFYSIIVGYSFFALFGSLKKHKTSFILIGLTIILIINAWVLIRGDSVNRILTQDTGTIVKSHFLSDPNLENLLSYFRNDKDTGRNLYFPIADFDYQILASKNHDGVYFGPSMISYLTGKADLGSNFMLRPFALGMFEAIKNKDYQAFSNIFPLLNITSFVYNSDPYIYEVFETFPYNDVKLYFPKKQIELQKVVGNFPLSKNQDFGKYYHLYSISKSFFLPTIYVPKNIEYIKSSTTSKANYDENAFKDATYVLNNFRNKDPKIDFQQVFLDSKSKIKEISVPGIKFSKISPAKYIISVKNSSKPYLIVFSQSFNSSWKIFESTNKKKIAENRHYLANAYANAWYILPQDVQNKKDYTLILELNDQKFVYIGFIISGLTLLSLIVLFVKELWKTKY